MKLSKEAVAYYVSITGKEWNEFYNKLDEAMTGNLEEQEGELWLIHILMNTIVANGTSVNEFKVNKDAVKAAFDEEGRKKAGEFFTPEVWAKEGRKLIEKYIPNWNNTYYAWETSAGSGNLFRTSGHDTSKLFLSTLQEDDVKMLKKAPEFQGAHIWQLDFLSAFNHDEFNAEFTAKLDPDLRRVLENDEPLVIYSNPPYKTGMAKATEVGRHMINDVFTSDEVFAATGAKTLAKPAYDIFYQFIWQYMDLVDKYNLSNTYCCFFGPLTFFTGSGATILLREFEHRFEFIDGMCISAQEFSDTSESILWGIGTTLWKARGGAQFEPGVNYHKDILLNKMFLMPDGSVGNEGRVLYEPPREKLSSWVAPKDTGLMLAEYPLMTSHLTFKGGDVFEKVAYKKAKMRTDALGVLMVGNTLTRSSDQSAVMSMPSTIQFEPVVEENFWRCVSSYTFRRVYDASWAVAKKEISAPNTNIEGYDLWLKNALVLFLFEYKSMQSSLRGVRYSDGSNDNITIRNHMFYLSADEVREVCNDEVILRDLENNPPTNSFMLAKIEECKPYWAPSIKQLYDWCIDYTKKTYAIRKDKQYRGSLECWDAGFQQIRTGLGMDEKTSEELTKLLVQARDYMRKDIDKFGFVSEVQSKDDL